MIASKMRRVLLFLEQNGQNLNGVWIGFSPGSEIQILVNGQLDELAHRVMLKWGFICNTPGEYIYRP